MESSKFLRERREVLDISQAELAKRLSNLGQETSHTRVSHWETGRNRLPLDNVQFRKALAVALEMSVNELMKELGFIDYADEEQSHAARRAAEIVDRLPPAIQDIALEYLELLQRNTDKVNRVTGG